MNAFTAKEYTCYYARVLDTDLPLAIDVVCDMLTGSLITAGGRRRRARRDPRRDRDDRGRPGRPGPRPVRAHAMFGDTPLGRPVLGTVETVNALTRDADHPLLPQALRPHPPGRRRGGQPRPRHRRRAGPPRLRAGRRPRATDAVPVAAARRHPRHSAPPAGSRSWTARTEQAHVVLGMPGLSRTDDRRWALGVLNTALGGGMSSRLFQEVREKRGLAYSRVLLHLRPTPTAACSASTPAASPSRVARGAEDLPGRAGRRRRPTASTDEELRRAIGQLSGSTVLGLEDTGALMNRIGKSELCWGEQLSVDEMLARIAAVTPDDVRDGRRRGARPAAVARRHRPAERTSTPPDCTKSVA